MNRNNLPTVIGFIGRIGSGKDRCCDILAAKFGYKKLGFSDPLYEQLAALNPIIKHPYPDLDKGQRYNELVEFYGIDWLKRNSPEVRAYLQKLGEECGRQAHGRDCWIKHMDRRIGPLDFVTIRDVRYVNEIDYIRSMSGIIIWVESDFAPERDTSHASEHLDYSRHADYFASNFKADPSFLETRLLQILGDYAVGPSR
jgi:hypothetical protein